MNKKVEIVEELDGRVTSIKVDGIILKNGDSVYHEKGKFWIDQVWFDSTLTGIEHGGKYYENHVRCDQGSIWDINDLKIK